MGRFSPLVCAIFINSYYYFLDTTQCQRYRSNIMALRRRPRDDVSILAAAVRHGTITPFYLLYSATFHAAVLSIYGTEPAISRYSAANVARRASVFSLG